jgi:ferredoxin
MKEVAVDWTRCEGHGLCAQVFPSAITSDEWGYPVFRRTRPRDDEELIEARRAVALCPALALRIEDVLSPRDAGVPR